MALRLAPAALLWSVALSLLLTNLSGPAIADDSPTSAEDVHKLAQQPPAPPPNGVVIDHSGRRQAGKVSTYAPHLAGRRMANGKPYDPKAKVAASKSLPLGAKAKVTNLQTGQSTTVTVEDRGPFVKGRVLDVTPRTAQDIGLTPKEGVAPAIVAPVTVPQPDGSVKPGAGADTETGTETETGK